MATVRAVYMKLSMFFINKGTLFPAVSGVRHEVH